jgi:hypothetical protein
MAALAALAASGLVSIDRRRVGDAVGSLASRSASVARICSAACRGPARPGDPPADYPFYLEWSAAA